MLQGKGLGRGESGLSGRSHGAIEVKEEVYHCRDPGVQRDGRRSQCVVRDSSQNRSSAPFDVFAHLHKVSVFLQAHILRPALFILSLAALAHRYLKTDLVPNSHVHESHRKCLLIEEESLLAADPGSLIMDLELKGIATLQIFTMMVRVLFGLN